MLPPRPALLFMLEPPPPPLAPPPLPRPHARPPLPPGPPPALRSGWFFNQPWQTERGVPTLGGVRGFLRVRSLPSPRQAPPSASPPPPAADPQLRPRFRDARPFRRPPVPGERGRRLPLPPRGLLRPEDRGRLAWRPRAAARLPRPALGEVGGTEPPERRRAAGSLSSRGRRRPPRLPRARRRDEAAPRSCSMSFF